MKTCKKCNTKKSFSDFYRMPGNNDGLSGKCKDCTKADVRSNYRKKREHYREYEKQRAMLPHRVMARERYSKTEAYKESARKSTNRYRARFPNKYKAHCIVNNAIRDGHLFKEPCESCGEENTHAHHDDYSKPLNVRWLCAAHHRQWHEENGEGANAR